MLVRMLLEVRVGEMASSTGQQSAAALIKFLAAAVANDVQEVRPDHRWRCGEDKYVLLLYRDEVRKKFDVILK